MSDIYIPELIELDSYWQKAVEDAICDTLKGEKRLYYALRNRNKINQKLKRLGLRPKSTVEGQKAKSRSNVEWDSSASSLEQDALSQGGPDPCKSKSPPEGQFKSPGRPLLGNGSLEKMKKSQNSFNCEPMDLAPESEEDEPADAGKAAREEPEDRKDRKDRKDHKDHKDHKDRKECQETAIEWLHVREGSAFADSDTEGSSKSVVRIADARVAELTLRNALPAAGNSGTQRIPSVMDPMEDLFWEKEVKDAIRRNVSLERRLNLALAKREILNDNLRGLRMGDSSDKIQIGESEAKSMERKRRRKQFLSPFIRFYLEVYRELCHKRPVREIAGEATRRWRAMSAAQKWGYRARGCRN